MGGGGGGGGGINDKLHRSFTGQGEQYNYGRAPPIVISVPVCGGEVLDSVVPRIRIYIVLQCHVVLWLLA